MSTDTIEETLAERGKNYGSFKTHAEISVGLREVFNLYGAKQMDPFQEEAIFMILHKVARIANGDPNYVDSWRDISGYATLVVNELKAKGYDG